MDVKRFFLGLGLLLAAYLFYRYFIKGQPPFSAETGWQGPTPSNYIGLWGGVVLLSMCGVALVLKSLFA